MKHLEAIADAIALLNAYNEPELESYRIRNPGMLRAKSIEQLGEATDSCIRIFSCHQAGYKALIDKLRKQCERKPKSTLQELLALYGHGNEFAVSTALDFIQRSLDVTDVNADTRLSFFLE